MKWMIAAALTSALVAGCGRTGSEVAAPVDEPVVEDLQPAADGAGGETGLAEDGQAADAGADASAGGGPGDVATGVEGSGGEELSDIEGTVAGDGSGLDEPVDVEGSAENVDGAGGGQGSVESGSGAQVGAAAPGDAASDAPSTAGEASASDDGAGNAAAPGSDPPAAVPGLPGSTAGGQDQAGAQGAAATIERPPGWDPGDPNTHELAIVRLRGLSYPGSDLVVVEQLAAGANYSRAVATYQSEGLTIRGLLTIPNGERPPTGWPVIIFNHGYIPPAQYRTTERYVPYQDAFARNGYITYKSDYRGHGSSEGDSASSRGSAAYMTDVLNAMASVARHPDADPSRIGMWGHSMGGLITLRSMVVNRQIKAGVIWAGVVASYQDLYNRLGEGPPRADGSQNPNRRRGWRTDLLETFGPPEQNPAAWDAVSANAHLADISGPIQLHHGTADHSVPVEHSTRLQEQMDAAGRPSELFVYQGDDHNLEGSLSTALARSVEFFDRHVKGGG